MRLSLWFPSILGWPWPRGPSRAGFWSYAVGLGQQGTSGAVWSPGLVQSETDDTTPAVPKLLWAWKCAGEDWSQRWSPRV